MDISFFSQRVETMQTKVSNLFNQLREPSKDEKAFLEQTFMELVTALEELRVAEEELTVQVHHLAESREKAEIDRMHYFNLLHFSPDALLMTDINGAIQEANPAAVKLLNKPARFMLGKPLILWLPEEERKQFRSLINKVIANGQPLHLDLRFRTAIKGDDQQPPWCVYRFFAGPVHNQQNQVIAIRWLIRDMTHLTQLEENNDRFQTIFQNNALGVLILNKKGRVTDASPAAERMLGYKVSEVIQLTSAELFHPEELQKVEDHFRQLADGVLDHYTLEVRAYGKNGREMWLRLSVSGCSGGVKSTGCAAAVLEDISREKEAQQRLFTLQNSMAESVHMVRHSLAQKLKTGPMEDLALVLGRLETILESGGGSPQETEEVRAGVQFALIALTDMVNEQLDSAPARFHLPNAIQVLMEQLRWEHAQLTCSFASEGPLDAISGPAQRDLFELLAAAVQTRLHTARPNEIHIQARVHPDKLELEIQDDRPSHGLQQQPEDSLRAGNITWAELTERVEALHGHISIDGLDFGSTAIRIVVPNSALPAERQQSQTA